MNEKIEKIKECSKDEAVFCKSKDCCKTLIADHERLEKELEFSQQVERSQAKDLQRLEKENEEMTYNAERERLKNEKLQRVCDCAEEIINCFAWVDEGKLRIPKWITEQIILKKLQALQQAIKESK